MTEINIICIVVLVGSCSFKVRLLLFGYIEVIYTVIKQKGEIHKYITRNFVEILIKTSRTQWFSQQERKKKRLYCGTWAMYKTAPPIPQ